MDTRERWERLEACPAADEGLWAEHVAGFVAAFITPAKRERWRELLTDRPRRVGRYSHKMHTDLDRRACAKAGTELRAGLVTGVGLFYHFAGGPSSCPPNCWSDFAPWTRSIRSCRVGWPCTSSTRMRSGCAGARAAGDRPL
jgi:hypothetical protein